MREKVITIRHEHTVEVIPTNSTVLGYVTGGLAIVGAYAVVKTVGRLFKS